MDAFVDFLRNIMPFLLPVLIVVGKQLKAVPFINNQLIPWALVALNVGRLWLIRFGWAVPGAGEGQPLEPAALAIGAPIFALVGIAGLGGALTTVLSFGAQLAVDHWLVNKTHKGLKYRAMYKLAEKMGAIQPGSTATIKGKVTW